jgi:hypothetical protein
MCAVETNAKSSQAFVYILRVMYDLIDFIYFLMKIKILFSLFAQQQ